LTTSCTRFASQASYFAVSVKSKDKKYSKKFTLEFMEVFDNECTKFASQASYFAVSVKSKDKKYSKKFTLEFMEVTSTPARWQPWSFGKDFTDQQ
jgi:hypothetical protein